ncbi:hypothetical protein FC82_GL000127 [Secundilactobacillus collinoides DSM 20515 = JCM 1123]|uniref:Uncharacterized protein n=1 Tax=Secundilactobacillus collinoides DSM 20515 = JCM 1123 TaxID=1423733 RepID=A0A0R2B780_SECCO|nr:hypothetical protein FC82_GL000127 [Secundilactobacillus collinoides DSM 20515 = JCM 1123]
MSNLTGSMKCNTKMRNKTGIPSTKAHPAPPTGHPNELKSKLKKIIPAQKRQQ